MMQGRDYDIIAKTLREAKIRASERRKIADALAVLFGRDNPRFKPARFVVACMTEEPDGNNTTSRKDRDVRHKAKV